MARKPIIAGNWKMNMTRAQATELIEELKPLVEGVKHDVVICVPYTDIDVAVKLCAGTKIKVGAENVAWAEKGAFTGEISADMLLELGTEYVIIGHSERRQYFGETNETVNLRLTAALNAGKYISAMGFDTTLAAPVISFVSMGVWAPVNWLLLLCITLLAITIAAVSTRYDAARVAENVTDTKYQLFYGGEKNVYSQVGGEDLFWGLKHNWRHYFDFMHKLHSGVVNDYALWAVVDVTVIMAFMLIAL
mgnify:CR=1 FL=1